MAELTLRLILNPSTGKRDLVVSLRSDDDALPHEHERMHKRLIEKVLEGGLAKADELGELVVRREQETPTAAPGNPREEGERPSLSEGA